MPEVALVLRHCTVVDGGYIHYKDLLGVVGPADPRAKRSTAKGAIYPSEEDLQNRKPLSGSVVGDNGQGFLGGLQEPIRKVYARWERGQLSSEAFKAELQGMGVVATAELERLLVTFGPSRAMPFGKLMCALQIDSSDGRRCRGEGPADGRAAAQRPPTADGLGLRQAICDFVDGRIPAVTLREHLRARGVRTTPEVDRLVRQHECDNSVRFQDFARAILRQDSAAYAAAAAPSGRGGLSGPPSGVRTPLEASPAPASGRSHPGGVAELRFGGATPGLSTSPYATADLGDGDEVASRPGTASSYVSVTPPFARYGDLPAPLAAWDPRGHRDRSGGASRARSGNGDIIGWCGASSAPPSPPGSSAPSAVALPDFLQWGPAPGEEESLAQPGKRHYGRRAPASEAAPFGRECDVGRKGSGIGPLASPFGTDQDMRLRRPEEAGTDEYRPSVPGLGRAQR
mmetsp:Transcript_2550/g.7645  ORF Transcript_2550/g.7645 Transcript_2550/m.7645 type:complete len:457 (+) Transcript_2550:1-1371(+)